MKQCVILLMILFLPRAVLFAQGSDVITRPLQTGLSGVSLEMPSGFPEYLAQAVTAAWERSLALESIRLQWESFSADLSWQNTDKPSTWSVSDSGLSLGGVKNAPPDTGASVLLRTSPQVAWSSGGEYPLGLTGSLPIDINFGNSVTVNPGVKASIDLDSYFAIPHDETSSAINEQIKALDIIKSDRDQRAALAQRVLTSLLSGLKTSQQLGQNEQDLRKYATQRDTLIRVQRYAESSIQVKEIDAKIIDAREQRASWLRTLSRLADEFTELTGLPWPVAVTGGEGEGDDELRFGTEAFSLPDIQAALDTLDSQQGWQIIQAQWSLSLARKQLDELSTVKKSLKTSSGVSLKTTMSDSITVEPALSAGLQGVWDEVAGSVNLSVPIAENQYPSISFSWTWTPPVASEDAYKRSSAERSIASAELRVKTQRDSFSSTLRSNRESGLDLLRKTASLQRNHELAGLKLTDAQAQSLKGIVTADTVADRAWDVKNSEYLLAQNVIDQWNWIWGIWSLGPGMEK